MTKYKYTFLLLVSIPFSLWASNYSKDSIPQRTNRYNTKIDSLASLWYNMQVSEGNDTSFVLGDLADTNFIPDFPDSVYIDRLNKMPMVMDMTYNTIVRNYIHMYSHKKRRSVERMLGLSEYYFPIFEEILDAKGIPLELKYLPIIESALNPIATSRVGATGMWQFMYYTGKSYKLEINSFVDERRDPVRASYAAADFLSDLYDIYHDWTLVIAAYNCGPGNVNKAIRRSGGKHNYWDIYYHLPRETRGYVPAFIAATYIMNHSKDHNLKAKACKLPILCDTIITNQKVHLEQISKVMDIPLSEIQSLNPQYRRNIIPSSKKGYTIRLPFDQTPRFIDLQDSIYAYNDSVYFNPAVLAKSPQHNSYYTKPSTKNLTKLLYTVKTGDNLGFISSWYGVRVSDLRRWNNIRRNMIRSGQKLTIYVPKNKASKYRNINHMSNAQKQNNTGQTVAKPTVIKSGEYELYTVRNGDTLWDIAKSYPGVSDSDIMKWNGISNASKISIGQKLKIKRKS